VSALSAAEGYRLWAPRYAEETAISFLEDAAVRALPIPPLRGSLLDVGCGTARRLASSCATWAVGVDASIGMLRHARGDAPLAAADVRALPFADASFDRIWCRLVIGHVAELEAAWAELGRVCRPGGHVIVTDFHADAVAAGHRRTFRDDAGIVREIEHHVHDAKAHDRAAARAGLDLVARWDEPVGPAIRPFYDHAGRLAAYEEQRGLPIVLVLVHRRRP
jgi:malonyl-CoA O-methyltransferase